jgi:dihydroneopterin aldolase
MEARIAVEGLDVDCLIGCLDPERRATQTLKVDAWLDVALGEATRSDELRDTVDYGEVARHVAFILQSGRFHLLESAAWVLLRWLTFPALVRSARVRLSKSGAIGNGAKAVVEASMEAGTYPVEHKSWGTVDVVAETRRLGLYRLTISPGARIPEHHHQRMRECELVLSGGLALAVDGDPVGALAPGRTFAWASGQRHAWSNVGTRGASILCLDSPPFDPADEIP